MADIDNRADILDSRDIEEHIDELESIQDSYIEDFETALEALEEARAEWEGAEPIAQHNGVDPSGELTEALAKAAIALVFFWNEELEREHGETFPALASRLLAAFRDDADDFKGNEELADLKAFRDELENYCPDWGHGTTLIRESYFVEYVQEMLTDIGDLPRYIAIDWDKTADNLRVDYTEGNFDGVTYLAC